MIKTVTEVRKGFWQAHPEHAPDYRKTYRQNQYGAYIGFDFTQYVDGLRRGGDITESLAKRATL